MPDSQSLQTIAEVSIGLAGFSGLAVALRRNSGPLTEVEKFRLRILLTLAFGAMFLSFLPELLQGLGMKTAVIWICACAALAVYSIVFLAWWVIASRKFSRDFPEIFHWSAFARMSAGHVTVLLLQMAVCLSLVTDKGATIFVLGLIWYLIHAAQQFSRMLFVQPRSSGRSGTSD